MARRRWAFLAYLLDDGSEDVSRSFHAIAIYRRIRYCSVDFLRVARRSSECRYASEVAITH